MAKLWVGGPDIGAPNGIEDRDLEDAFSKYGKIMKVWVAHQPPGFAFIDFDDERDAEDAIKEVRPAVSWR